MLQTQRRRREYRCHEIDPITGQPCYTVCSRPWNLKRHQRDQHQDRELVFMYYNPTAPQRNKATFPAEAQWTRTPVLSPSVPIASIQESTAAHGPAQMIQAPTVFPQALSSTPTMTPVSSVSTRLRPVLTYVEQQGRTSALKPVQLPQKWDKAVMSNLRPALA